MLSHTLRFFTILAVLIAYAPVERADISPAKPGAAVANARASRSFGRLSAGSRDSRQGASATQLTAGFLPVQSRDVKNLGPGKLLVASRDLADPNFAHTVVLLVHYDAKGVVGLVLNRRTDLPLSRVFKELKAAKDRSDRVYLGGPVEAPAVFALLQSPKRLPGAEHVFGTTYLINTKALFEQTIAARPDPATFHVYLGYAGWAQNQLRMEVAQGAWFIFQSDAGTVFSSDPGSLWPQMIRKTELKLASGGSSVADQSTPVPDEQSSLLVDTP